MSNESDRLKNFQHPNSKQRPCCDTKNGQASNIEFENIKNNLNMANQQSPLRNTYNFGVLNEVDVDDDHGQPPNEFTEVFSWGSDRYGQLGLGQ